MTAIPEAIYAALTPAQRVAASVAALAREDKLEVARLLTSCPKRTFVMADPDFTDGMNRLSALSVAHESDLRGLALDWMAGNYARVRERQKGVEKPVDERLAKLDAVDAILAEFASIEAGLALFLESEGIDPSDFAKFGLPPHRLVDAMKTVEVGEVEPELASAYAETCRQILHEKAC